MDFVSQRSLNIHNTHVQILSQLFEAFHFSHTALFEAVVQPVLFSLGFAGHIEWAFDATFWFLVGAIEISLLWIFVGTAQRFWPVEPIRDKKTVRTDFIYTLIHRLGGFTILAYILTQPLADDLQAGLSSLGFEPFNLERLIPGVTDVAWVSFALYFLVFDLIEYWVHRAQHQWEWWWALHSLHHSQQQMTVWSDNRNHLLVDLLRDGLFVFIALLIGAAPAQFITWIVLSRAMQSLQHANLRWRFGGILERLVVSPSFHRLHHAIGVGHEGRQFGCNFGVVLSCWDVLFRSGNWRAGFVPTGVSDQLRGADYGAGFWHQQWLGFGRMKRALIKSNKVKIS